MDSSHVKESRRPMLALDADARIAIINGEIWIDCPQTVMVEKIIRNMTAAKGRSQAPCLLVCGAGGTGKTSLINKLRNGEEHWTKKIAFARLSENADGLRFCDQILLALGVPPAVGGGARKHLGLVKYLELTGKSAVIIDEFHDGLLANKQEQRKNLSLLKDLSGPPYHISIIGFGVESALNALQQDRQLERRFEVVQMLPWKETEEFRQFLASIEENLPLRKPSGLYDKQIVRFLLMRTDGTMDAIINIIRFSAIQAVRSGEERVTLEMLEKGISVRWAY
ncbi:TniB family NTP-binding protein [Pseudomonas aeruginosa]|uniref:TniB family NTP-binding protein n=1 Tax=Pseudomonas aeruginosa TaxID=287 RepID=UPI0009A3A94F|nr:TniB family NTP-binding protein [Pseudomonas aeruginosa]EKV8015542.1 TniB family NTP-binding protein [Pseudomonas aeruginosa]EKX2802082.1 TniB family NTP-binding protein [Pseudomonas aeruginosa]MBG5798890.1 TniB family NTP-binding protein [Pseudomonas aeruginosa]MBH3771392.1 TniB family NTP-binding protein [Pseudomonas aeruginosa]MBP8320007.1 TniB family NTP-binding protein [Pseudomonas aeruginosa]